MSAWGFDKNIAILPSTVQTGAGTGSVATVSGRLGRFSRAQILLDITAITVGTGTDTLDVWLQKAVHNASNPQVTYWTDFIRFQQTLASATVGNATRYLYALAIDRAQATVTGTPLTMKSTAAPFNLTTGFAQNGPWGDDWQVQWTAVGTSAFTFNVYAQLWVG